MARCSVRYHLLLVRSCMGQISLPRPHSGRVATHLGCVRQRGCVRHVVALERSLRPLATRLVLSVFPSLGRDAAGYIRIQVPHPVLRCRTPLRATRVACRVHHACHRYRSQSEEVRIRGECVGVCKSSNDDPQPMLSIPLIRQRGDTRAVETPLPALVVCNHSAGIELLQTACAHRGPGSFNDVRSP